MHIKEYLAPERQEIIRKKMREIALTYGFSNNHMMRECGMKQSKSISDFLWKEQTATIKTLRKYEMFVERYNT